MGLTFEDGIAKGFEALEDRFAVALMMYAKTSAASLESYAREHAPWTNRTGHARQRLTCEESVADNGYKLTLSHGVDYGLYLEGTNNPKLSTGYSNELSGAVAELAFEKKYAIIQPTIRSKGPKVMEGLNKLLEK